MISIVAFAALPLAGVFIGAIAGKPLIGRICGSILSFEGFFVAGCIFAITSDYGWRQELFGASGFWLGFAVCGGLFLISLLLIWRPFKAKPRRAAALSLMAAIIALAGSAAGAQAYKNSFIEIGDMDREINLGQYMPFGDRSEAGGGATLVKTLDEPPTLALADSLPRLDGATALYPLYSAFVRATYPEGDYYPYNGLEGMEPLNEGDAATPVVCSQTSGALDNLFNGYVEIAFVMGISEEQAEDARSLGLELELTPIGREAFVFLVNSRNRAGNLTQEDIRGIYSGAITNWRQVGGANDRIEAYQRPEGSGSQTALQKIMGGAPVMEPKNEQVYSFMGGLYNAVADYKNYRNAIGYSFRFYIESMLNDAELNKVKLLSIDGVAPTVENISSGAYPFADNFYAVTVSNRAPKDEAEKARIENARRLIDWILSGQGQALVEKTGYVAVK
jgi:phosphate transport system substrate-binding protein